MEAAIQEVIDVIVSYTRIFFILGVTAFLMSIITEFAFPGFAQRLRGWLFPATIAAIAIGFVGEFVDRFL